MDEVHIAFGCWNPNVDWPHRFAFVAAIAVDVVVVAFVVHVVVRFVLLSLLIYRYLFLYLRCRAIRVAAVLLHMGLSGIGMPDVLGHCTQCKSP